MQTRWLWNSVERSKGGHERRRRIFHRMTVEEADALGRKHALCLERVDCSA
jgi:hypothetical protein